MRSMLCPTTHQDFKPDFIVDLSSHLGIIAVSGSDALRFLQGQLTQDIQQISENELKLAAFCNLKGRVLALFEIFKKDDHFFLQCPKDVLEVTLSELKKFARFSKVKIENKSDEMRIVGLIGEMPSELSNFKDLQILKVSGNVPRIEMVGTKNEISSFMEKSQLSTSTKPIKDFNHWALINIRSGIPEVRLNTRGVFLVHQLNLPELGAVSFNKGCYVGQEIVARTEYRGNVKRKMLHQVNINPESLHKEMVEKEVTLISTAINEKNELEGLILPD